MALPVFVELSGILLPAPMEEMRVEMPLCRLDQLVADLKVLLLASVEFSEILPPAPMEETMAETPLCPTDQLAADLKVLLPMNLKVLLPVSL